VTSTTTTAKAWDTLQTLPGFKRVGKGWKARCPAHPDRHPSLDISISDEHAVLLTCRSAGCSPEEIVRALELEMRDLFPPKSGAKGLARRAPRRRGGGGPHPSFDASRATTQRSEQGEESPSAGCTLTQYAELKGLPIAFLAGQGLSDISYQGAPAVRIPYFGPDGRELLSVQFRTALHKPTDGPDLRFKFKSGNQAVLYGQWKVSEARRAGHITLVEGASDCHTLWFHEEPALGFPGANAWKDERDAPLLDDIGTIYLVVEPDAGGEAVKKWLAASRIRDRVRLVQLPREMKDPSALHLAGKADHDAFRETWQRALANAVSWAEVEAKASRATASAAWEQCADLAQQDHILDVFYEALAARGVAGEERAAKLLYLAMTSRMFDRPASVIVKAPSSTGKSFVAEQVAQFFPPEAYSLLTAMSERALVYNDEVLAHRVLIIAEASGFEGGMGNYLIRSLLSEGRLVYPTVEKTPDGLVGRTIEKEGPTGLIVGTTAVSLHAENETRHISLPVTDTPEQTRAVFRALARSLKRKTSSENLERWRALQTWLGTLPEPQVDIPYAEDLAELVPPVAVRLRRDFKTLLVLIQTHAFLHHRSRGRDAEGRIVATLDDYAVIRELVADLVAQGVEASVPPIVRETVVAVEALAEANNSALASDGVPFAALVSHLKLDKSTVSRRVKVALAREYLRNLQEKRGQPMLLSAGAPMPKDEDILPTVEALQERCTVAGVAPQEGSTPPPPSRTCLRCRMWCWQWGGSAWIAGCIAGKGAA
jgi:hypothetical protein